MKSGRCWRNRRWYNRRVDTYRTVKRMKVETTEELRQHFKAIPWASFGRQTPVSKLARSIVPVGNLPKDRVTGGPGTILATSREEGWEDQVMDIEGTAFQVGRGKLVTCWHVCEALQVKEGLAYLMATSLQGNMLKSTYCEIVTKHSFIDVRLNKGNKEVDVGMLIAPAKNSAEFTYDIPPVVWGDSTALGVGDRILIGGFPLGRSMFLAPATNRGIVQPAFYEGIVSAIVPATRNTETRILQLSSMALGGISGGVVCEPDTGRVVGMVTSGLETSDGRELPITYAIPSEVLEPYTAAINFEVEGKVWR